MAKEPTPVRITTATRSRREDIAMRQRRYLISMGIRTACFLLAVVSIGHWWLWLFIAASFVLPTVAVIVANSNASPDPGGPDYFQPDPTQRAIRGPSSPDAR